MANIQEIVTPVAATVTTLYTATGNEVISTIQVSNTSTSTTYSIYIVPSGESYGDDYAFPKGATIQANELISFTMGMTPKAGTVIRVVSTSGNVNFIIHGQ